jgi:uncharacterized cupredoxin-like copper-binding protein
MFRLWRSAALAAAVILVVAGAGGLVAGCGDEDDAGGDVTIIGQTPESGGGDEAAELTPGPVPEGATVVDVTLKEWEIIVGSALAPAGPVYFRVANAGPDHPHEFVVIRSDLAPDALPVEDGKVPEDEVELLDEIEPFAVGSTGSLTLDLEPGNYVLICNIVETEDGQLESHYEQGMRAAFVVE